MTHHHGLQPAPNFDPETVTRASEARKQYRLRDIKTGEFVNMLDLSKRTKDPNYAYQATDRQILNASALHPHMRGMIRELQRP